MFEDISDPSRNRAPLVSWRYPTESVGASFHARLLCAVISVVVVADAVGNRGTKPGEVLLRDGLLLVLLALVWISRSPVAAGLVCAITFVSPLVDAHRSWSPLFMACLWCLWMCILFRRFRREEASATPPDEPRQPETPS